MDKETVLNLEILRAISLIREEVMVFILETPLVPVTAKATVQTRETTMDLAQETIRETVLPPAVTTAPEIRLTEETIQIQEIILRNQLEVQRIYKNYKQIRQPDWLLLYSVYVAFLTKK